MGIHIHASAQQHGDHHCVAPPCSRMQQGLAVRVIQAQATALGDTRTHNPERRLGREDQGAPRAGARPGRWPSEVSQDQKGACPQWAGTGCLRPAKGLVLQGSPAP